MSTAKQKGAPSALGAVRGSAFLGNQFIVRLEPGVWLADGEGDPPRTIVEANARRFESHKAARIALTDAKLWRPFRGASVRTVPRLSPNS